MILAHEDAKQPVGKVVEVVQAVAQERVGLALQTGAHVTLHLLDRSLGRQTVADRFLHAPHPAAVIGEHTVGLEHVAMLAGLGDVVARQHVVDEQAQAGDGFVEAAGFMLDVLADEGGDDDARLVQDDVTEADTFAEADADDGERPLDVDGRARPPDARQFADGDHFGEHHRRRL